MNLSVKPQPLLAHWVPGFVILIVVLFSVCQWRFDQILKLMDSAGLAVAVTFAVVAFVVGQFLDSVRDILDGFWHSIFKRKINWRFFFEGDSQQLQNLNEWFFTYYVLNANLVVGLLLVLLPGSYLMTIPNSILTWMWIAAGVFLVDAVFLRIEIQKLIPEKSHL